LPELQAILAVADPEWRSLILFGLYTGQRLSDLVTLGWNNIDLERGEVRLVTGKTNRRMIIPMAPPLRSHLESLPAGEDPQAPLHPHAFAILSRTGSASAISQAFSDLLVQAGLRARPASVSHRGRGNRPQRAGERLMRFRFTVCAERRQRCYTRPESQAP
jgi:integrase